MKLPKFWNDTGPNNDLVVQLSIVSSLITWLIIGWKFDIRWLLLAALILGPASGFLIGISIVHLLSTYCNARNRN